mmetsp:Transcript_46231/g.83285  ORF Transcript_46231/g.83285 Transcript_46231/m.83285 type:complete len:414 (+) Transcript_46231:151-1392(+)
MMCLATRRLLLAALLLASLSPAAATSSEASPEAVCDAKSGRCSSLIQSAHNATRAALGAHAVKAAPKVEGTPDKVASKLKDTSDKVFSTAHKPAKLPVLGKETEAQLLQASRLIVSTLSGDSMTILSVTVTVLILAMIGALLYLQVQPGKPEASQTPAGRSSFTSRASLSGAASMLPSARAVPSAPRPGAEARGRPSSMPDPQASLAADPRMSMGNALFLCPELVVPDMTECTLMLPRLSDSFQVTIDDTRGVSVFRAEFYKKPMEDGTRLVLSSPAGDVVFAMCRDSQAAKQLGSSGSTSSALAIYSKKDQSRPFGLIRLKEDNSFEVMTSRGQCIRFQGKWPSGSLNALDEQGQLLALSDPAQDGPGGVARRTVRIGPLVDAGLMAISYLGIDVLQMEASKTPTFSGSRFA